MKITSDISFTILLSDVALIILISENNDVEHNRLLLYTFVWLHQQAMTMVWFVVIVISISTGNESKLHMGARRMHEFSPLLD